MEPNKSFVEKIRLQDVFLFLSVVVIISSILVKAQLSQAGNIYAQFGQSAQISQGLVKNAIVLNQETLPVSETGKVWQIGFFEEFSGATIDSSKWNFNGDYARKENPNKWFLKNNAYLDGRGKLVLRATYDATTGNYSGTNIDTNGKATPKFGYISAKIDSDSSGFWAVSGDTINVDGSGMDGSEIDIAERWDKTFVNHAIHWDGYGADHKFEYNFDYTGTGVDGFHEYGVNWQPAAYKFYVDGQEGFTTATGGVSRQPGYIILGAPHFGNPPKFTDYTYVDYVHAYDQVALASLNYKIIQYSDPKNQVNYTDSTGKELNDGKFASSSYTDPAWVGIWGGVPKYYFDISLASTTAPVSEVYFHVLRLKNAGIYLPPKIQLVCDGFVLPSYWSVPAPTEDGLYQIILKELPETCSNRVLRVWNGWWTFMSEITTKSSFGDTVPPSVSISSPSNGATIIPPKYSEVSGNSVTITANASDNVGVAGVQFKLDGQPIGAEDTVAPYSTVLDSTRYKNGFHSLSATARDFAGNSTSFLNVILTVVNATTSSDKATAPTVLGASISPKPILADGLTAYMITLTSEDVNGAADIGAQYAIINKELAAGMQRGYVGWAKQASDFASKYYWANGVYGPTRTCDGGGVAGQSSNTGYGENYINVVSCSTSVSGNTRTTNIVVTFNTNFTSPSVNTISTKAFDAGVLGSPWQVFDSFTLR